MDFWISVGRNDRHGSRRHGRRQSAPVHGMRQTLYFQTYKADTVLLEAMQMEGADAGVALKEEETWPDRRLRLKANADADQAARRATMVQPVDLRDGDYLAAG